MDRGRGAVSFAMSISVSICVCGAHDGPRSVLPRNLIASREVLDGFLDL